jgi:hypothetical protein
VNKSYLCLAYIFTLLGAIFPRAAGAVEGYVGGVPVEYYYGHPVPDMFHIAGTEFDDRIADIKSGLKDVFEKFEVLDGTLPHPPGFPKEYERIADRAQLWSWILRILNLIPGDQRLSEVQLELTPPMEIPAEVGGEDGPIYQGRDIDPGSLRPDYTGDFGADFGGDFSGIANMPIGLLRNHDSQSR